MLVLSRKSNEEIVIGSNIRVKVLEIKGNRVRLGIIAPDYVPVIRKEIFTRIEGLHDGKLEFELIGTTV